MTCETPDSTGGLLVVGLTAFAGAEDMARRHGAATQTLLPRDLTAEMTARHDLLTRARTLFADAQKNLDDCARMRGL